MMTRWRFSWRLCCCRSLVSQTAQRSEMNPEKVQVTWNLLITCEFWRAVGGFHGDDLWATVKELRVGVIGFHGEETKTPTVAPGQFLGLLLYLLIFSSGPPLFPTKKKTNQTKTRSLLEGKGHWITLKYSFLRELLPINHHDFVLQKWYNAHLRKVRWANPNTQMKFISQHEAKAQTVPVQVKKIKPKCSKTS